MRLLDVPADAGAGLGIFEDLHGRGSGAAFSKGLERAAAAYYGTAGPAFVAMVIERRDAVPVFVKELQEEFGRAHVSGDAGSQVHRAAMRFALVGAAGEIASHSGLRVGANEPR